MPMDIADCYRVLGLRSGASIAEVKASYRRLARQYHPDINPNDARSHEKFIQLHEAYKILLEVAPPAIEAPKQPPANATAASKPPAAASPPPQPAKTTVTRKAPSFRENPRLSTEEQQVKQNSYLQLQYFLKSQRFPRAIALAEALAQRIPHDPEVRQWLAITYQRWGRHLVDEGQLEKARIYLKKALRTDPHNRSLWSEVERDFRRMEKVFR